MLSLGRVVTSSQLALRGLFVRISSAHQVAIEHDWSLTCAEAGHSDVHLVKGAHAYLSVALMMVVFFQGARLALVKFDPLLSSRDMASVILHNSPGQIIVDHHYYTFSFIAFYAGRVELLLNGHWNNFEYGANAPGVPDVFINDGKLKTLWSEPQRYYLVAKSDELLRLQALLGRGKFQILDVSGGKFLLTNIPFMSQ
jgi:hypothetical protein